MTNFISLPYKMITAWIDSTTMYLIVVYMLGLLAFMSVMAGIFGLVAATAPAQLIALFVGVTTAYVVSVLAARMRGITANHHSSIITALIIFFLLLPEMTLESNVILAGTVAVAIASKYIVVFRGQHIVNPAALGVVLLGFTGLGYASWWVASPWLLVPIILTGVVVVAKIRKWVPVGMFIATSLIVYLVEGMYMGFDLVSSTTEFFLYAPALFLGFFMLTEPFTMPPTKKLQGMYGIGVGFLANTALLHPFLPMTAELALVIGNLVLYPTTLRRKLFLSLQSKREIAQNIWEFVFTKPSGVTFKAGQYLEWMLPHATPDIRGIRRYFTIVSSPTEDTIRVACKMMRPGSSYKSALLALPIGGTIIASQRAGSFLLPADTTKKIAMVAGGIGVTPFRSQVQYMIDTRAATDSVLFYGSNTKAEMAYSGIWDTAKTSLPFRLVAIFAKEEPATEYEVGYFNADIAKRHTPDLLERMWYVSGPPPMVNATVATLRTLGVPHRQIVQDFFPGLA